VRRAVPRLFRDFTTQGGGPGWHHYQVVSLLSLPAAYAPRGIGRYRREAAARCGQNAAAKSWVVFLQFPEAPMASADTDHIFVAKTARGWVGWR
jgi:hypothetical protein